MRKHLTASLSACLVAASFVGCGEKSQEAQVSEKLDTLLDHMSRLQYADAPIEGNNLEYTLGKEVAGVKVPGSTRFEAAYLDQALALLPLAEEIKNEGSKIQKQSANSIIGSIRTDEASFLIDEAERVFQNVANDVIGLRGKVALLREIQAINNAVANDRSEIIETYRTGLSVGGASVVGINDLQEEASAAAAAASKASQDLSTYNQQISELREKIAEYESLELKLTGQARSDQSATKYEKLDQATAAAREAELAQAQTQKLEIDVWISERLAKLAELKRQRLAGAPSATTAQLINKLSDFLSEASQETNVPTSSDVYADVAQMITDAKAASGDDVLNSAAFLLSLSAYGTEAAANSDVRNNLVTAMDSRINEFLGVIGILEMKIAQIKLDQQRVADKLADIERDRQLVLADLTAEYDKHDAMIQAAAFDRMAAAVESLKLAEQAVKEAGSGTDMELMSVYMLHARALQQQRVSARTYLTTLKSIALAGPDILGSELHAKVTGRVQGLEQLLTQVNEAAGELQTEAGTVAMNLTSSISEETPRGQIAMRQVEVYESLLSSLGQGGVTNEITEPTAPEETP